MAIHPVKYGTREGIPLSGKVIESEPLARERDIITERIKKLSSCADIAKQLSGLSDILPMIISLSVAHRTV